MKLTTEKISEQRIDIEVDTNGGFSATFNDQDFNAKTRLELIEQLKKAVKRFERVTPVEVTILGLVRKKNRKSWDSEAFEQGAGAVNAKLRGRHVRNRVWLMESDDDDKACKFHLGGYKSDGTIVRRLTPKETLRYNELLEQKRVAETALEDFVGSVKVDPYQALNNAAAAKGVE